MKVLFVVVVNGSGTRSGARRRSTAAATRQ
jgi:hypothetical protein